MFKPAISIPLVTAAIVAAAAGPASALGTPPVWLTGNSTGYQEWTLTSISAVGLDVVELESPQGFTGDSFSEEPLSTFDVVYSENGNFAYGIGDMTENYYAFDLDDDTMEVVSEDLGTVGDDNIETFAANGDAGYVTYVNPATDMVALGSINYGTFGIDNIVDLQGAGIPMSLGYFDGEFYVITEENGEFVLQSIDSETGELTVLHGLDGNVTDVRDGDIDNNGNFRSLTKDNDNRTIIFEYNVLTGADDTNVLSGVDLSGLAYWGTPDEVTATGGGNGSGDLASTGLGDTTPVLVTAILGITAGVVLAGRVRRARTR